MNRHLAGFLLFAAIIGGSYAAVRHFKPPSTTPGPTSHPVPDSDPPPPQPPDEPGPAGRIDGKVDMMSLDVDRKRADARVTLEWKSDDAPPNRVWIWVWTFKSGDSSARSADPVEVRDPFRSGRRATVTVQIPCPWVKAADFKSPVSLYARMHASATSKDAARIDLDAKALSATGATPVVVEAPSK